MYAAFVEKLGELVSVGVGRPDRESRGADFAAFSCSWSRQMAAESLHLLTSSLWFPERLALFESLDEKSRVDLLIECVNKPRIYARAPDLALDLTYLVATRGRFIGAIANFSSTHAYARSQTLCMF